MPALCAARIFQLTRELGHKSDGETIQWLLQQAEPSILAATGTGTIPQSALAAAAAAPPALPSASVPAGLQGGKLEDQLGAVRPNWAALVGGGIGRPQLTAELWPSLGGFGPGFVPATSQIPSSSNMTGAGGGGGAGAGGGDGHGPAGFLQRMTVPGMEFLGATLGAPMSFTSILGGGGHHIPGLELGLSQDGHMGIPNPQAFSQFYQHMGRVGVAVGGGASSGQDGGGSDRSDDQLQQQQQQQQNHQAGEQTPSSQDDDSQGSDN